MTEKLSLGMIEILKIRASILKFTRNWLDNNGYLEIPAPIMVKEPIERQLSFKLDYCGRDAFLTHNGQLYLEMAAVSVGNAWTINPSFRSEKTESHRHLSEFFLLQIEKMDVNDLEGVLEIQENLISELIDYLFKERLESFKSLKIRFGYLKDIKPHFDKIKYDKAIRILRSKDYRVNRDEKKRYIQWGDDLDHNAERELTQDRLKPLFVTHYPVKLRPFYIKHDPDHDNTSLGVDLLAPKGFGEITSGGIREDNVGNLRKELKKRYNSETMFKWYCDIKMDNLPLHGGFGLGIERLARWLTNKRDIKNVLLFPRTPSIIEP